MVCYEFFSLLGLIPKNPYVNIFTYFIPRAPFNKKIVPLNIGELLTPAGLAFWAQDDGGLHGSGLILSTHCFSLNETEYYNLF